jgi:competence protein ComEA
VVGMSRRDAGAARQGARHARDRLQSTLGGTDSPAPLLADGGGGVFEYDGGARLSDPESGSGASPDGPAAGNIGPALRWRVGFRAALLIGALAVLGAAWFWFQVATGQPQVVPLADVSSEESPAPGQEPSAGQESDPDPPEPPKPDAAAPAPGVVIIHVAGAVAAPGVVHLPAGSRVHQAIAAAGGGTPAADLHRLNLAAVLADGQKLYIPQAGEQLPAQSPDQPAGEGAASGNQAGSGKVNLNTAGVQELDTLPKVGPVLAQRIVDWRKEHGPFKSVEELDAIDGVGARMLETLLPLVSV